MKLPKLTAAGCLGGCLGSIITVAAAYLLAGILTAAVMSLGGGGFQLLYVVAWPILWWMAAILFGLWIAGG